MLEDNNFIELENRINSIVKLPPNELMLFKSKILLKEIDVNELLVKEGEISTKIYYVVSGLFRTYLNHDGVKINTEFFFEDSFMSAFTSYLTQQKTTLNIESIERSIIIEIPKAHLEDLYIQNPKWYSLGKRIFEEEFIKKCRRESSFLKNSAKERYLDLIVQYPQIEGRVALFHIASYLGIQPETLSRIRSGKLTYIK